MREFGTGSKRILALYQESRKLSTKKSHSEPNIRIIKARHRLPSQVLGAWLRNQILYQYDRFKVLLFQRSGCNAALIHIRSAHCTAQ